VRDISGLPLIKPEFYFRILFFITKCLSVLFGSTFYTHFAIN